MHKVSLLNMSNNKKDSLVSLLLNAKGSRVIPSCTHCTTFAFLGIVSLHPSFGTLSVYRNSFRTVFAVNLVG